MVRRDRIERSLWIEFSYAEMGEHREKSMGGRFSMQR
jgi:hypothetical protein